MNPLTRRQSAVTRPQFAVAVLIAIALAFTATATTTSTAEAGRGGRRAKKSRSHPRADKPARHRRAKPPTPAPGVATADDGAAVEARPTGSGTAPAGRKAPDKPRGEKVFDFTGLELAGSVRMPQLLYFLDRAEEELERASLERRSFVPAMMRSLDEENL